MAMTPEQRRARDAERKRVQRAAQRAAREANIMDGRTGDASKVSREMRDAVDAALAHMQWLKPSDEASKVQARSLARTVDEMNHAGEVTKALSAQRALSAVLNDLGGTPAVRLQRELRASRHAAKDVPDAPAGKGGAQGERKSAAGTGGIVTAFERPKPRRE